MAVAGVLAFLAANPGLVAAVPGAVTGLIGIIKQLGAKFSDDTELQAALDKMAEELAAEATAVKNTPLRPVI